MADRELQNINSSGELTEIRIGGVDDTKIVLTKQQIDALFGNWNFDGNNIQINDNTVIRDLFGSGQLVWFQTPDEKVYVNLTPNNARLQWNGDGNLRSLVDFSQDQAAINIYDTDNNTKGLYIRTIEGVELLGQSIADIEAGSGTMVITKEWSLAKFPTIADVDGKFGNYSFDGDVQSVGGSVIIEFDAGTFGINTDGLELVIGGEEITFGSITDESIEQTGLRSAITSGWALAKFFQQTQFINAFTGSAGEPIKTALDGKIDASLVTISVGELQGNFTPTGGDEYPVKTSTASDYWIVENVAEPAGYTFTGGELLGNTVYNGAWMQLDTNLNWVLANNYPGATTAWGGIVGTLLDQTDLVNYVESKFQDWVLTTSVMTVAGVEALSKSGTGLQVGQGFDSTRVLSGIVRFNNLTIASIDSDINQSAITKEWAYDKFLTDAALGNWTFVGTELRYITTVMMEVNSNVIQIGTTAEVQGVEFPQLDNGKIATTGAKSAVTKEYVDAGDANQLSPAVDPGDSTATSIGQLTADYNTLLSNLRTAGIIA